MISQIERDLPEYHGLLSSSLRTLFTRIEQSKLNVNRFMLLQNGKATAEFYRVPYRKESPQLLFSLSKSFTSIAIGIARDEQYLNLNDKVSAFFPEQLPDSVSENLSRMTIHHLLSMNAGHHDNIYGDVAQEADWVKAYLAAEVVRQPGTYYRYSTHSTYMLSAIIEKATGQNLLDFLRPRLFEPLGVTQPSWETCPMGIAAGGMGLSIPFEGVAKFGQMLLDKGVFNGRRIVSEEYIRLATAKQSDTSRDEKRVDFAQGYGYQFFLCRDGCFMGNGGYGQLCFVAPHRNIVIAAASSFSSMVQLQSLLDLLYEHVIHPISADRLPARKDHPNELHEYTSSIAYPFPEAGGLPDDRPVQLDGGQYSIEDNLQHIKRVGFRTEGKRFLNFKLHLRIKPTRPIYSSGTS
ncbi:serine hydrolase domain-containing protein [Paenibacillus spongiae]|uniref:Beta-lactamase family protein n=1 Tax=Paenibacillus spongiae TaxID=2909671 RepID=A0ABY5S9B9_9BACL|nr:serine hydrolase [Paenibacillus spongiae]UVI29427.1 beta-lactamase family protein [Paenibacillus spongiae]